AHQRPCAVTIMNVDELSERWNANERIRGVAFSKGEIVLVRSGPHSGSRAVVVSLLRINPDIRYLVEPVSDGPISDGPIDVRQDHLLGASAVEDALAVAELQRWYASQCDEDWE